jgi:hypothetical protein
MRFALPLARIALPALMALAIVPLAPSTPALAHERRDVGNVQFVVGFIDEPAIQDEPNGIDLTITDTATQQPVEGAEKTLKATIAFGGGQPKEFPLRARFRMPGKYTADLIPTRSGTYIFTFSGDINGQSVNERFESGPGRFNDVQPATELQFPVRELSPAETAARLDEAQQAAAQARTLALGGLVVGALGLIVGTLGFLAGRRREPTAGLKPVSQEGRG